MGDGDHECNAMTKAVLMKETVHACQLDKRQVQLPVPNYAITFAKRYATKLKKHSIPTSTKYGMRHWVPGLQFKDVPQGLGGFDEIAGEEDTAGTNEADYSPDDWLTYGQMKFPKTSVGPKMQGLTSDNETRLQTEELLELQLDSLEKYDIASVLHCILLVDPTDLIPLPLVLANDAQLYGIYGDKHFLPLELFDDVLFETRTPEEWLDCGQGRDGKQYCVPAWAFLPICGERDLIQGVYPHHRWEEVGVYEYDRETQTYSTMPVTLERGPYKMPRLLVCFKAENIFIAARRIRDAVNERNLAENKIRYQAMVQFIPKDAAPPYDLDDLFSLLDKATNFGKKKVFHRPIQHVVKFYSQTITDLYVQKMKTEYPEIYSYINIPERTFWKPELGGIQTDMQSYQSVKEMLRVNWIFSHPRVWHIIMTTVDECARARTYCPFAIEECAYISLTDFSQLQDAASSKLMKYLNNDFRNAVINVIKFELKDFGRGHFDIFQKDWTFYKFSKIPRILGLTRFLMEKAMHDLVDNGIQRYAEMMESLCSSAMNVKANFVWGNDLVNTHFPAKIPPIFSIELILHSDDPFYSTPPENFPEVIIGKFEKAIRDTHFVERLGRHVNTKLRYSENVYLTSRGLLEPEVAEPLEKMTAAVESILIPLRAYALEYRRFLPLFDLDVEQYVQKYSDESRAPSEVKEEIDRLMAEREALRAMIPEFICIGPFHITTYKIRQMLVDKKSDTIVRQLKSYAVRVTEKIYEATTEYLTIMIKLSEKPQNVEMIVEMKEWMETIPFSVKAQIEIIKRILQEYELLDIYWWMLTDEEFEIKWGAICWPYKISVKMMEVNKILADEWLTFQRIQVDDEMTMQDKIETITANITAIALQDNIVRVHEIAVDVRRTWKMLREVIDQGHVLNTRQKIFGLPVQTYEEVHKLGKEFEPFKNLWTTASDWLKLHEILTDNPLITIDSDDMDYQVGEYYKTVSKCIRIFADHPACVKIAVDIRDQIDDFRPLVPIIHCLRNPGMKKRHWDRITDETGVNITMTPQLTLRRCMEMGLQEYAELLKEVSDYATKEFGIEGNLEKMESEWDDIDMIVTPYKQTGTFIMKVNDEVLQMLDDQIGMTQQLSFSPFKGPFEERINDWERRLRLAQAVIEEWTECQRQWIYLEPIFASEDITSQLPFENKKFLSVCRSWKRIMKYASENTKVILTCPERRLLDQFRNNNHALEIVQKGLSEYLEMKRLGFPRFFFLSDDELLEILAQARNPLAVQPHLRKCFENIKKLTFQEDLNITHMWSAEGECVRLIPSMYPRGTVEVWLLKVEHTMKNTLRETTGSALKEIEASSRGTWVLRWPGQVVIAGCQTYWTTHVEMGISENSLSQYYELMLLHMDIYRNLVRGDLKNMERQVLSALIVIEVHARDVLHNLVTLKVSSVNEFDWISQLRYYWLGADLAVRAVNAQFPYGYEYLGNSGRLVITPLTDRCYLTLTGALHLKFGGAPAGPAGTGKTETTKDLAKAFAIQCVVFNCSDQLDFMAMGKFFKGLASSGAWACFDEFNRIDIEVLSVIAQQITTIQKAQMARAERFMFEGSDIKLEASCAVFITMNPGYAGRTELPDNLKALFRPVAMMVPDYTLIAEISLFSFGFSNAKNLAGKITMTFKLSSEQLSSQDHYDFGMRAVKTVITVAGNLKREHPLMDENQIVWRALKDVNVPKFLVNDLTLFNGIVSDLFPRLTEETVDYGKLELSIRKTIVKDGLEDVNDYVKKVIQLYETVVVRHGLMLVGPTGSGKTMCYEILRDAMTSLKGEMSPSGSSFETVWSYVLNPKSITMGQLYGEFDLQTHEWTDGILPSLVRIGVSADDRDKRWYVFDGPVDAVWIENMNSVLDDNKKLCLTSGEIIKFTDNMTLIFEVADLAVASPATVSRCGMVYLEPSVLGLKPYVNCWLKRLPDLGKHLREPLKDLIDIYLLPAVKFMRAHMKEIVTSVDSAVVQSFLRLLDCCLSPLMMLDNKPPPPTAALPLMDNLVAPWVVFSLIWSVGATCDSASRVKFSSWVRSIMESRRHLPLFPPGLVYDYRLHDGGFTTPTEDNDYAPPRWLNWMHGVEDYRITPDTKYSDIEVPTIDNVRSSEVIGILLNNRNNVLCVGPTGTGKTVTVLSKLNRNMPKKFMCDFINFSARTSANQTQDLIESKLEKRRKGVLGPPLMKCLLLFIDDFNMPALEVFGAQPPIELIRQWMDFKGWYNRLVVGEFRYLVDINFVAAMGPPGGGRNPVTHRLLRHFHYIAFTELGRDSQESIFRTILRFWMDRTPELSYMTESILQATLSVYSTIVSELLPTPAKTHYTFNLRDLSKVFQGIHMANPEDMKIEDDVLKLWVHENCRVFQDRLINDTDRNWFDELLGKYLTTVFKFTTFFSSRTLLYGDFLNPNEQRVYGEITDMIKLSKVLDKYLDDYNKNTTAPMRLVLFLDAIGHICRIARIIRQPFGNGLLLGMGGSGRQSLTRLSTFLSEFICFQIELSKNYGNNEWREDIKSAMLRAGLYGRETVFLFSDTQILLESFLEDINNILNSGDVPNIYGAEELDKIFQMMRAPVSDAGLLTTKSNMFAFYLKSVRSNMHCVITMSPIGDLFRARLRQFPALVNCCTIDWFFPWPDAALQSVALQFLDNIPGLESSIESVVLMCRYMHQNIIDASALFLQELSRHNYVTPTSFLELLSLYISMLERKKKEQTDAISRLQLGLDKLLSTSEDVKLLQIELIKLQPALEQAQVEAGLMLAKIEADTAVAEQTKEVVQAEEEAAAKMAEETQNIADDAQKDLDEAMPALQAAESALKSLNKNDITEVRAMQRPPEGVKMVLEVICILKNVKPKLVPGQKLGEKIMDYWEPARNMLSDPGLFLNSLLNFDKESLSDAHMSKIQPYIDNPDFRPQKIIKVSKACTSLCQWVHAMYQYYFVNLAVAPKRAKLAEAMERLEMTERTLAKSRLRMKKVMDNLNALNDKLRETMDRKNELERNSQQCQARLNQAFRLINGLSNERKRWIESIASMQITLQNIVGDMLISAGAVAYLAPFTDKYRRGLLLQWRDLLVDLSVPHSASCDPVSTLGDPVSIRRWQLNGLPRDYFSTENGILVFNSKRWPLFIDPQGQANKWIKNTYKGQDLIVMKLNDKELMRQVEGALSFGKVVVVENVGTEIDPSLDPVLVKQIFYQSGQNWIKLGDSVIPYNSDFKMFLTTKLANPHYTPEISTKVLLVNFMLVPSGLQDQLLALVALEERPDLEETRSRIIISVAQMKAELKDLEDKILTKLSQSQGNPVDDIALIDTLEESKAMSEDIRERVESSAKTQEIIDHIRSEYVPVARRAQILYFCLADLAYVDPMYQYSLEWFTKLFVNSMAKTDKNCEVVDRIVIINDHFTFSLYANVCRSLFERNKLQFAFLMCVRILMDDGRVDPSEWSFLLSGGATPEELSDIKNPAPDWIGQRTWLELLSLENIPCFLGFVEYFMMNLDYYKGLIDSPTPHRMEMTPQFKTQLNDFQKLVVLKTLRPDKFKNAIQDYVSANLGPQFIEPQSFDLEAMYKESSSTIPLIFVLSTGTDPAAELFKFADRMRMNKRMLSISLGQGQGPIAEKMFKDSIEVGNWVFFQNCHLAPSWMPRLEYLIENIQADSSHKDFRVWLTSTPSPSFPVSILQNGSKLTIEPPRGVKANLLRAYLNQASEYNDFLNSDHPKAQTFKWLLFALCLFHGVCLERRKFGPLGFNIAYEFTDGDLRICISQLNMFLKEYTDVPFKVLTYTAGQINYGGRVTDDWDRRCIMNILADYYSPLVVKSLFYFDEEKLYYQLPPNTEMVDYMDYLKALPVNDRPELFGLHQNADISCALAETYLSLSILANLQPKQVGSQSSSQEEVASNVAQSILNQVPKPFPSIKDIEDKYPVLYEESLNTVLIQEVLRFNKLLSTIHNSLQDLLKALVGLVVMSDELEKMCASLFNNVVPKMWSAKAYPSLKPLAAWVTDLQLRIQFIETWIEKGIPTSFWISGFYFPQAFLTGCLQNFARKRLVAIDTVTYQFKILNQSPSQRPSDGCVIYGLYLEGARWSPEVMALRESKPKELYTDMPPIWLIPESERVKPTKGIYDSPVYKTLQRAGTLSTTGHSTNYVLTIEIPTSVEQRHWIKRGVALICALDF